MWTFLEGHMNHALEDRLIMLAEMSIKPDLLEEFLEYTASNLSISRAYPGNLAFDILIDEACPERVIFYEVWTSSQAQQAYMTWRVEAGDLSKLLTFLADAPRFTSLRSISGRDQPA